MKKESPTFYKDGYRRIKCPYCGKIVGKKDRKVLETKLTHSTTRRCQCCHCKKEFLLTPPLKGMYSINNKIQPGIKWGPEEASTVTTDLTELKKCGTVPLE